MSIQILKDTVHGITLVDETTKYTLALTYATPDDLPKHYDITFWHQDITAKMNITTRDLDDYPQGYREFQFDKKMRVMEWGPGLGGWLEHIINCKNQKPTVIDNANFECMEKLLTAMSRFTLPPHRRQRLDAIRRRCDLILDSTQVELVRRPADRLLVRNKEWLEAFDLVNDHFGPLAYAGNQYDVLADIAWQYVKPGGYLLETDGTPFHKPLRK